jgi:hypothetical protein
MAVDQERHRQRQQKRHRDVGRPEMRIARVQERQRHEQRRHQRRCVVPEPSRDAEDDEDGCRPERGR